MDGLRRLGTVVMLNNGKHPLMITGRLVMNADTGERFDYVGVLYPEGYLGEKTHFLFGEADVSREIGIDEACELDRAFMEKVSNG